MDRNLAVILILVLYQVLMLAVCLLPTQSGH